MMRILVALSLAFVIACGGGRGGSRPPPTSPAVPAAPLTAETLRTYLQNRFPAAIVSGALQLEFASESDAVTLLDELTLFGVTNTAELAAIVPADFDKRGFEAAQDSVDPTTNIMGLMRDLMIIHDVAKYRDTVWRNAWSASGPEDFVLPIAYDVPVAELKAFWGGDDPDEGGDDVPGGVVDGDPCGDPCYGGDPCAP